LALREKRREEVNRFELSADRRERKEAAFG